MSTRTREKDRNESCKTLSAEKSRKKAFRNSLGKQLVESKIRYQEKYAVFARDFVF